MSDKERLTGLNVLTMESCDIEISDGIIASVSPSVDKNPQLFICPGGMVDIQVNGFLGMDYSDPLFSWEYADFISRALAKEGTLQHFATIVTRPQDTIIKNIESIVKARRESPYARNSITGIHIEGPFIAYEDGPRGAHDINSVRKASIREFDQWLECSEGLLKYITVGAESDGVDELIEHAVSKGVVCSIGHTGASREQIDRAVEAGASLSTHLGNGVYSKLDRFDNPIWAQLRNDGLTAGIICDGDHLAPDLVWIISRCKSPDRIILVSDLSQCAGLPVGRMKWGNIDVEVVEDGSVRLAGTPYLAGAGSQLLRNAWNYAEFTKTGKADAFRLGTINPIRKFNLDIRRTMLRVGEKAEFIAFEDKGNGYELKRVYADGEIAV